MSFAGEIKIWQVTWVKLVNTFFFFFLITKCLDVLVLQQCISSSVASFYSLGQGLGLTPASTWSTSLGTGHGSVLPGPQPWLFIHLIYPSAFIQQMYWSAEDQDGCRSRHCLRWVYSAVNGRNAHTEMCSISWETALRRPLWAQSLPCLERREVLLSCASWDVFLPILHCFHFW